MTGHYPGNEEAQRFVSKPALLGLATGVHSIITRGQASVLVSYLFKSDHQPLLKTAFFLTRRYLIPVKISLNHGSIKHINNHEGNTYVCTYVIQFS